MQKLLTLTTLGTLTAALTGMSTMTSIASAQSISAQSIIVNPAPTNVAVRVWTDRDASGNAVPAYTPGEKIRLYTSVNQDAYVYLFNVDPNGRVDLILPNTYQSGGNFLKANTVKVFPSAGDPFTFDIAAPYGVNKVLALASRTPLNLNDIATFKSQQAGFASVNVQGQQRLAQALSIVVSPIPQNTWNSATAYYQVVSQAAVAQPAPIAVVVQPTVQPLSINVTPNTTNTPVVPGRSPWGNDMHWRTTVDARFDLRAVHDEFAARLRAEGYTLVKTEAKRNEIESQFRLSGNRAVGWAKLKVERKGNRIEVKVDREVERKD